MDQRGNGMKNTKNRKKRMRCLTAVCLSLALTATGTFPAFAASETGKMNAGGVVTVSGTVAQKTTPTCDPVLARRVLVAMGVVTGSQTTTAGLKKQVTRQQFAKMLVQLSPYNFPIWEQTRSL